MDEKEILGIMVEFLKEKEDGYSFSFHSLLDEIGFSIEEDYFDSFIIYDDLIIEAAKKDIWIEESRPEYDEDGDIIRTTGLLIDQELVCHHNHSKYFKAHFSSDKIKSFVFSESSFVGVNNKAYRLERKGKGFSLEMVPRLYYLEKVGTCDISIDKGQELLDEIFLRTNMSKWAPEYTDRMVLDGTGWSVEIENIYGEKIKMEGDNRFPRGYYSIENAFLHLFEEIN